MSDLRLENALFSFEGRSYTLRCNMNVLADAARFAACWSFWRP